MDPATAAAGAAVVVSAIGAIAGARSRAKAGRKADAAAKQKDAEIQSLYNSLIPPEFDLSPSAPPELIEKELRKPKYRTWIRSIKFSPEQIKKIGTFVPQAAKLIKEKSPQLIKETATTQKGRRAEEAALDAYQRVGKSRDDPEFRMLVDRAKKRAQSEAQSRGQTIKSQMARRGMSGSGLELAAQMGSSASAMDRMAEVEQEAAANAYRNRLEALARGAQLGGRMRRDDQDIQDRNNSLINSFNQRMSSRRQDLELKRINDINDANASNLADRQRLHELNRSREDDIVRHDRNDALNRIRRDDDIADKNYRRAEAERAYENKRRTAIADWKERQRDRADELTDRMYGYTTDNVDRKAGRAATARDRMYDSHIRRGEEAAENWEKGAKIVGDAMGAGGRYMENQNKEAALAAKKREEEEAKKKVKKNKPGPAGSRGLYV